MASEIALMVRLFPVASTPCRTRVEGLGRVGWRGLAGG